MINYNLTRSARKTIAIHITKDAQISVKAPLRATISTIDNFVQSKSAWILKHQTAIFNRINQREAFKLDYGTRVLYRGYEYPLCATMAKTASFCGDYFSIPQGLAADEIKARLVVAYRALAKEYLPVRIAHFAEIMGVTPTAVKINSASTHWGSCSGKNSINFSWRLILAEDCVIDYVVVHELAHIKQHNHSPRFWAEVATVLPNYKLAQQRLKLLHQRLLIENFA